LAVTIRVPVLATGASINAGIMARYVDGNNYYFVELAFGVDQSIRIQLRKFEGGALSIYTNPIVDGLIHDTRAAYRLRYQVTGGTMRAKVWLAGTPEPDWQVTAADTVFGMGAVGCRSALVSGNTNTLPVTVDFDDFVILSPTRVIDAPTALVPTVTDT